jgi:hypothetical protein
LPFSSFAVSASCCCVARSRHLFPASPFAGSVLHGTTLRLCYGGAVHLFAHAEIGLHPGFLVKHLPNRRRFVAAMFLIGQRLKRPIEGARKSNRDRRRFLVPHAAKCVIATRERQEFSLTDFCPLYALRLIGPNSWQQLKHRIPSGTRLVCHRGIPLVRLFFQKEQELSTAGKFATIWFAFRTGNSN